MTQRTHLLHLLAAVPLLHACASSTPMPTAHPTPPDNPPIPKPIGMPNPASVHCLNLGGKLLPVQDERGTHAMCLLPDGSRVEEWTLYRRDQPQRSDSGDKPPSSVGWIFSKT